MFALRVDNEPREENEFWSDQLIWRRAVDSETTGLELMIRGLIFARQQIAFTNLEDHNETLSPLQGPGTIFYAFIHKLPCIFDLKSPH